MPAFQGTLRPHQEKSLEWVLKKENKGCVLSLEMGLGKTIVSIAVVVTNPIKTLVIVPLSIMTQWESEFEKFSTGLTVMIYHGVNRKNLIDDIDDADVVITTYNTFVSDLKNENTEHYDLFERVIVDEAHKMKNRKSMMHMSFVELFSDVKNKILLTGTPICNSEHDLISLFLLLNRRPYNDLEYWKGTNKDLVFEELQKLRRRYMLIMLAEKTIPNELPELTIENVIVPFKMAPEQEKVYNRVLRMPTEGRGKMLQKISKLRLCVNDNKLIKIDDNVTSELAEKIAVVTKIIESTPKDEKIIIFSSWLKMLNILNDEISEDCMLFHGSLRKEEKDAILLNFKKPRTARILLITIRSGSVGLNLNIANNCIIVEPYWAKTEEDQAIKRLYRMGQEKPVKVYKIMISNTIENWMTKLQEGKTKIVNKILFGKGNTQDIEECFAAKDEMFNQFVKVKIEEE